MTMALAFESDQHFISHLADVDFWRPFVLDILRRHQLDDGQAIQAGFNATHPTFLCGDVVIKFFGHIPAWRRAFEAEHAAQVFVSSNGHVAAPPLLASGTLQDNADLPWPYLITARVRGDTWKRVALTEEQNFSLAMELGVQVQHLHALSPSGLATHDDWRTVDIAAANGRSSLPPHLVAQIDDFLSSLALTTAVACHSDLVANHVYIESGCLTGIIDWGDAMAIDRHYEIIQPFRDIFDCDKNLLRAFLGASDWPVDKHFHYRALGLALHRQAIGLAQHRSMDVFEPIALRFPLDDIATLDELARELFAV